MTRARAAALGAAAGLGMVALARECRGRWTRQNYAGRDVSLAAGASAAAAVALADAIAGGRTGRVAALAAVGAGSFGAIDDHVERPEQRHIKGLRGHLGALRRGTLTTGGLKVIGISASAAAAAGLLGVDRRDARGSAVATAADLLVDAGVIAGSANLINLLDLRPGRALKAVGAIAGTLAAKGGPAGPAAAGIAAVALAHLPDDLAERTMLGDTGANALGAALGVALAARPGRAARVGVLAALVGLTLASERVSFSATIERVAPLRRIDAWGRRPITGTAHR